MFFLCVRSAYFNWGWMGGGISKIDVKVGERLLCQHISSAVLICTQSGIAWQHEGETSLFKQLQYNRFHHFIMHKADINVTNVFCDSYQFVIFQVFQNSFCQARNFTLSQDAFFLSLLEHKLLNKLHASCVLCHLCKNIISETPLTFLTTSFLNL